MQKFGASRLLLASLGLAVLLAAPPAAATAADASAPPALVSRGESINEAFTALTGEAVNPLFGVAAIGLFNYLKADPDARPLLPLHDQPIVWVPLLVIIALMLANSTLCEAMPWLKIPLNALGDLVNKGGAVAVLPLVVKMFADAVAQPMQDYIARGADFVFPAAYAADFVVPAGGGGLGFGLGWLAGAVVGTAIYLAVWMSANVVDVLIMICPFPGLDALLKSLRLAVVGALMAAPAVSPALGAALAVAIVIVSAALAGWSFRLSAFGLLYSTDILFFRKENFDPAGAAFAFSSAALKRTHGLPMRTPGRLESGPDGALRFSYRPWLVLARRSVELGQAKDFAAGRGLLNPFVVAADGADEILLRFSPRFRGREEDLRRAFALAGVMDCGLSGNLRHWLENVAGGKTATA